MDNLCNSKELQDTFLSFCQTIAKLRHPKDGCPWDLEQTHASLRKYMLEEAYEAVDAMSSKDSDKIKEELGDVLLQVVLNAQLGFDAKKFSLIDVIRGIDAKMLRRHPHVFAHAETSQLDSAQEVRDQWQTIKAKEKGKASDQSYFGSKEIQKRLPASIQAMAIGEAAQKINFDWPSAKEVFLQFASEVEELKNALAKASYKPSADVEDELGDVFFSLAQLCRHLGFDPEVSAYGGNQKFLKRFIKLERLAKQDGINIEQASLEVLEKLWQRAKALD